MTANDARGGFRAVPKLLRYRIPFLTSTYRNDMVWQQGMNLLDSFGLVSQLNQDTGIYRIGFKEAAAQHPHDRWVYETTGPRPSPYEYLEDELEAKISPRWSIISEVRLQAQEPARKMGDLVDHFTSLEADCGDVRDASGADLSNQEILRRMQVFSVLARIPSRHTLSDLAMITHLPEVLNHRQVHDLLYHWPDWLRRNPEYAEMPRDIIYRMHGLGVLTQANFQVVNLDSQCRVR